MKGITFTTHKLNGVIRPAVFVTKAKFEKVHALLESKLGGYFGCYDFKSEFYIYPTENSIHGDDSVVRVIHEAYFKKPYTFVSKAFSYTVGSPK